MSQAQNFYCFLIVKILLFVNSCHYKAICIHKSFSMKYFVISKEVILALFKSFIAKCHLSPFLKRGDFFALTCHCRQYFETLCFAHYILMNVGTPYHLLLLLLRPQVYHFRRTSIRICVSLCIANILFTTSNNQIYEFRIPNIDN